MAGLTTTGITIKNIDELLSDLESQQLADNPELNVEADSAVGQLNGVVAAALAEAWELLEEIYQSAYPDTASGQSLAYIAALTGTIKRAATKATLDVHLEGTVDTVVPAGTQAYIDGDPDSIFQTTAPATITEQGATDYVAVTIQALEEGSAVFAPNTPGLALVISTPVTGLDAVTIDGSDAFLEGFDEETDSELRIRREQSLALAGSCTVDAIRADVLTVAGVDSCTVFENPTGVTDALGVPPYAIEVLVFSEAAPAYTAQDVVDQIWASKPAGTETHGSLSGTAVDSSGNLHTVKYSEPTTVRTYVEVTLTAETDGTYVGDTGVADAIAEWATRTLLVGQDVFASDIVNIVADLAGVISVDVTATEVDNQTPTVSTDFITTSRQLATIATGDVTVTS